MNETKKRRRLGLSVLLALLALLTGLYVGRTVRQNREKQAVAEADALAVQGNLLSLKEQASRLKADLKGVLGCMAEQDTEAALAGTETVRSDTEALRRILARPVWQLAEALPVVGDELKDALRLADLVDDALDEVLLPLLYRMREEPLSGLTAEGGFNVRLIRDYLDFLPALVPSVDALALRLADIDLSLADPEGKLAAYEERLTSLLADYHELEGYIPLLKAVLGGGGDRFYVFAAQNSAEIRSSGGFPGAMGSIRIRDGILTLGEFTTVYELLPAFTPDLSWITDAERWIFTDKLAVPRDADYCPDFERVAYVWAISYEYQNGQYVDGVVSMTPAVVQKLLAFLGEITLSDGTVLNGENAARVLQHEIYYDYLARDGKKFNGGNFRILDAFWEETAGAVMELVTESFSPALLGNYLSVIKEGAADRTIMLWMAEPEEQALVRALGWSGGLNTDPTRPEAGIYYSCADASKLGWYVGMDAECGEPTVNADGSKTYDITVTVTNRMDRNTVQNASWYIIGSRGGLILSNMQLYAPAGGSIDAVENNYDVYFFYGTDAGLGIAFANGFVLRPDKPLVITYRVTTAPVETEPLRFSMTPTLQEYW